MKTKAELKAALTSLQVNKPLRLQARQPQFAPPTSVSVEPQVSTETTVSVVTPVAALTPAVPVTGAIGDTEVSALTSVGPETQVNPETRVGAVSGMTQVDVVTPVSPRTQVNEEGASHSASAQDSSVTLEAQTVSKLHNGYTRLPNGYLMRMVAGELQRSEIQILLLIARFTVSFQRRHAPLSKTVLERQTGLSGPGVLQAVSSLLAKGLIEKIPGDQHRPNLLGLVFAEEWDFFPPPSGSRDSKTSVARAPGAATLTQVTSVAPEGTHTPAPAITPVSAATNAPVIAVTPTEATTVTDFKVTTYPAFTQELGKAYE